MSYIKEGICAYTTNIFGDTNNKIVKFNREIFDVSNYHSTIYDQSKFVNTSDIPKFYLVIYTITDPYRDIRLNTNLETYVFKNGENDDRCCYYCSNGNLTHTSIDVVYLKPNDYIELYVSKIFGSKENRFKTILDLYEIGNENDSNIKLSYYFDDIFSFAINADKTKIIPITFNKSLFDNDSSNLENTKIYNKSNKTKCFLVSYYIYFQTDLYVDGFNDNRHNRFFRNFWISINGDDNIRYANSCSRDSTISKLDMIILKPNDYVELRGYIHSLSRREDRTIGNIHKWDKCKIHLYETSDFITTRPEQLLLFYDDKKIELKYDEYIDIPISIPCYTMKNKKLSYDNNGLITCMNDIESIYLINYQFYQETTYDCVYTLIHSYLLKNDEIYGSYIGYDQFINISCLIQLKKGDIIKLRCLGKCNVKDSQEKYRIVYINSENVHHNGKLILPLSVKYPKIQVLELGEI